MNIESNLSKVKRSKPYLKKEKITRKIFEKNHEVLTKTGYEIGDYIRLGVLKREFDIFNVDWFDDADQSQSLINEVIENSVKYEQTYEGYFINPDGTLDYLEMMDTLEWMIKKGCKKLNPYLRELRLKGEDIDLRHPSFNEFTNIFKNNKGCFYYLPWKIKTRIAFPPQPLFARATEVVKV